MGSKANRQGLWSDYCTAPPESFMAQKIYRQESGGGRMFGQNKQRLTSCCTPASLMYCSVSRAYSRSRVGVELYIATRVIMLETFRVLTLKSDCDCQMGLVILTSVHANTEVYAKK